MSTENADGTINGAPLPQQHFTANIFIYDGLNEVPDDITHVRVDPSVTVIPDWAFENHNNLQEVELPEGIINNNRTSSF